MTGISAPIYCTLSERLVYLRTRRFAITLRTQSECIAEATGHTIAISYLSKLEKGGASPTLTTLAKIAAGYGMTVQELIAPVVIGWEDEPDAARDGMKISICDRCGDRFQRPQSDRSGPLCQRCLTILENDVKDTTSGGAQPEVLGVGGAGVLAGGAGAPGPGGGGLDGRRVDHRAHGVRNTGYRFPVR